MSIATETVETLSELVAWLITPLLWLCAAILALVFLLGGIGLSIVFAFILGLSWLQNKAYQIAGCK